MVIQSSNLSMGSEMEFATSVKQSTSLFFGNSVKDSTKSVDKNTSNQVSDFDTALHNGSSPGLRSQMSNVNGINRRFNSNKADTLMLQTLQYLLRHMNRIYVNRQRPSFISILNEHQAYNNMINDLTLYERNSYEYSESESASFSTKGTVVTSDGREISFDVNLEMTRSFVESYSELSEHNFDEVPLCFDPLVINLDSGNVNVSDQKFRFDIDSDGTLDNISMPTKESGFLALDLNNDGIINNGNELFGTKSGDGFADLAKYDEDGNGWIDENDSVFKKLLIYTIDENGNEELYHLKEKNVGAICLEKVPTNFQLKNEKNMTNGIIRSTGMFLYEDGTAGTVQHLDLTM